MNRYFDCFGLPGTFVLTMLLSLSALVFALIQPGKRSRWLVFLAMAMSSAGDVFMTNFRGVSRYVPDSFACGAAAFMVSHVLYAAAYRRMAKARGCRLWNGGAVIAAVVAVGCVVYFTRMCVLRRNFGRFPLAMAYLAVISVNLAAVFSYAWARVRKNPLTLLAALGAAAFFASDFIIGLGMLARITRYDYLIWWLYPIGQMLLIGAPVVIDIADKNP